VCKFISPPYYRGRLSFLYLRINEVFLPAIIGHGTAITVPRGNFWPTLKGYATPSRSRNMALARDIFQARTLAETSATRIRGRESSRGETETRSAQHGCSALQLISRYDPDRDIRRTVCPECLSANGSFNDNQLARSYTHPHTSPPTRTT